MSWLQGTQVGPEPNKKQLVFSEYTVLPEPRAPQKAQAVLVTLPKRSRRQGCREAA